MIGVLDLQGGVVEHLGHLSQLGVRGRRVKGPADLEGLRGLVLPGGESTCLRRLLRSSGLDAAIGERVRSDDLALWGTCAGAILLATHVVDEGDPLGLIDIIVRRNAFGSQLDSFTATRSVSAVAAEPIPLVFIRAPQILETGPSVQVLLDMGEYIAAAESERVLVTVFHPELSPCLAFHRYFMSKCGLTDGASAGDADDVAAGKTWPRLGRVMGEIDQSLLYRSR